VVLRFAQVCTGVEADNVLLQEIYFLYRTWASSTGSRLSLFWDMRKAQYAWLNGPYGPHTYVDCQAEGLDGPLVSGFGTQPRSFHMRLKLLYLRRTAHVFNRILLVFFLFILLSI